MKKFWAVLVTISIVLLIVAIVGNGYLAIHRHNTSRYCNQIASNKTDTDPDVIAIRYSDNGVNYKATAKNAAYNRYYLTCIRSH